MARSTGPSLALLCLLALAGQVLAADTGMLYVKSNPPGATVVIGGKERGRTPVLVRSLPVGELTVQLRIAGGKPVAKDTIVRANKVARIDVTIDVPSATLTVLSDPLEARVFLDDREVGKTPLTLELLDPGEHQVVLLKDGYPRTARSVVLAAGAERVLEVKLGTAGSEEANDETERPAAGESVAQAAKSVPVEVQLILTMLKDAVAKDNLAETRRNLEAALRQADMADFKDEIRSAIRVMRVLADRQDAMRRGAEGLIGKDVTFKTKTGPRKGTVEGTSVDGITIVSKIMIDRRLVGESRGTVKWSDFSIEEVDRLAASWKPEGPDGAVARALLALARRDKAAAVRAIAAAGEHPLRKCLGERAATSRSESAGAAWRAIERKIRASRMSFAKAGRLLDEVAAFKARHGEGELAASLLARIAEMESRLRRARAQALGVPPDAVEFGGHSYKLFTQPMPWEQAKSFCERKKGHVATITSQEEHQFLLGMCQGRARVAWMGLTDLRKEGHWQWVTGEKFAFTAWAPGEPNSSAPEADYGELCIATRHPYLNGRWNDGIGRLPWPFICEWEAAARAKRGSGLVAHWTFDEGRGSVARDSSGNGNHAAIRGGQWAEGRINGAFGTVAARDRVAVARTPRLEPSSAISVAIWVKVKGVSSPGFSDLVRKASHNGAGYNIRWDHRNGRIRWSPKHGVLRVDDTQANTTYRNAWHHVAGTYDGRTGIARLYVDGKEKNAATGTPGGLMHSGGLFLMGADYSGQVTVLGLIDDVRIYSRALSAAEIYTLAGGIDSGLVAHWELDDGAGLTALDSSGNGNDGTLTGMVGNEWTTGKIGGALSFDGTDDYVSAPHSAALNAYPITVSAWLATTTLSSDAKGIVNKYISVSYDGYQLYLVNGVLYAFYFSNGLANCVFDGAYGLNGGAVNDGGWHHVCLVIDASGGKLYVDGTEVDSLGWTGSPGAPTTAQDVSIGSIPGNPNWFLDGLIDDVRVYSRALSVAEIQALAGM